jgi:protein-S-isoprenylcysteine O-methyltransferase Ste14
VAQEPAGQDHDDGRTAGVVARPPLLFLGGLLLGHVADHLFRVPIAVSELGAVGWIIGGVLIAGGLALAAAGIRDFSRAGTPVPTNEPTRSLVTTGAHGFSRNPIYVGMFTIYAGVAIADESVWALLLALPLAVVMRYGVVAREEAYLERLFGNAYLEYKSHVRRWL